MKPIKSVTSQGQHQQAQSTRQDQDDPGIGGFPKEKCEGQHNQCSNPSTPKDLTVFTP